MTRARSRTGAALWLLLSLSAACGEETPTRSQNNPPNMQTAALSCVANTPHACACLGQGMGTQLCNPTGNGYGACTGCPPPPPPMTMGGSAAPGTAGGGGSAGSSGSGGSGMQAAMDAGMTMSPDAGPDGGGEPTPGLGKVRGISCGVGLPTLCEIGEQKCCVRSLATDTCIEASASCDCDVQGCTVMETNCDGPEDCESGQVCCGSLAQSGNGYDSFECATQCQATGQQRVACHKDETECPSGLVCANSQLLTNVQVCVDPATIEQ